jgi:hypothetical protein
MKKLKNMLPVLSITCLALLMLAMVGCGSNTSIPATPVQSKTTTVDSVTADGSGTVSASKTLQSPTGNTVTIAANTVMTDSSGQPVTGTITTSISYSTNAADLPAAAITAQPTGATLAAFLDISIGSAHNFTPGLSVQMNLNPVVAKAGDTVVIYSFNTTTNTWDPADTITVGQDGTITFTVRHLSIWAAFKTATPLPGKPSGIQLTAADSQVTVSWTAPSIGSPTSYNVYYGTAPGVTTTSGTKVPLADASTSKTVTGLTNGTPYYFVVTAVNANGEGGISSEKSATPNPTAAPGAPTGVQVSAGTGKVTVSWTAVTGATSYNIYYSSDSNSTTSTLLASGTKVSAAASPTDVTGLSSATKYYFIVTAVNSFGESAAQSNPKTATTP